MRKSKSTSARSFGRRFWWQVHHWVGLKFTLLVSLILLTGTIAVFSHEIDWALRPEMRAAPIAVDDIAWAQMAQAVASEHDDWRIDMMEAPQASYFAARVIVRDEEGARRVIYANPEAGAIQGQYGWLSVQRVVRNMHRHLFLPKAFGIPIVSSLSILLAISLVTSLLVYKKWWRGFFKPVRRISPRIMLGDTHRLMGVWSIWFLFLVSATGLWYFAESVGLAAPDQIESAGIAGDDLSVLSLAQGIDSALEAARAQRPNLKIHQILFPESGTAAFGFRGQDGDLLVRHRVNAVWIDVVTHEPVLDLYGADLSGHARIAEAADPIHFGTFAGLWSRVIWFVFGLSLTAMSLSGVAIYSMRLAKNAGGHFRAIAKGMGVGGLIALAVIIAGIYFLPTSF